MGNTSSREFFILLNFIFVSCFEYPLILIFNRIFNEHLCIHIFFIFHHTLKTNDLPSCNNSRTIPRISKWGWMENPPKLLQGGLGRRELLDKWETNKTNKNWHRQKQNLFLPHWRNRIHPEQHVTIEVTLEERWRPEKEYPVRCQRQWRDKWEVGKVVGRRKTAVTKALWRRISAVLVAREV